MKNLTQLIQEMKFTPYDLRGMWSNEENKEVIIKQLNLKLNILVQRSLISIIRSEIDRKKDMIRPTQEPLLEYYKDGYNYALTEDIAYLENVLQELEKNI